MALTIAFFLGLIYCIIIGVNSVCGSVQDGALLTLIKLFVITFPPALVLQLRKAFAL